MTSYRKPGPRKGADKDLRRARDRFGSRKTQHALNEAIEAVPGVTVFDAERIIEQLGERLGEFKQFPSGAEGNRAFRSKVTVWVTRQARFVTLLREMLPALPVDDRTATLLLLRLPEFHGNEDEFTEWLTVTAKNEKDGLRMLADWITHHRMAVYRGAWRVLRSCRDLDNCLDDIADCVASATWLYVADNVNEFLNSSKPVTKKLSDKAENIARAWKSEKLRSDEGRPAVGYQIGLNGLEKIAQGEDGESTLEISEEDVKDSNSELNPLIIRIPWTRDDFDCEVRRVLRVNGAGPFRADDVYESDARALAAA